MGTEVRGGVGAEPPVEHRGERCGLPAASRQVTFQHEHQHDISLCYEVSHVFGNHCQVPSPSEGGDIPVIRGTQSHLSYMGGIARVPGSQHLGG